MVPLYTDPVRVARINDEIPQYRESKRANIACKKAIENLLAERFDGMRRFLPQAAVEMIRARRRVYATVFFMVISFEIILFS